MRRPPTALPMSTCSRSSPRFRQPRPAASIAACATSACSRRGGAPPRGPDRAAVSDTDPSGPPLAGPFRNLAEVSLFGAGTPHVSVGVGR